MAPEGRDIVIWVGVGLAAEDPHALLRLAADEMDVPLGLVGVRGEPLAWAPQTDEGRRAAAVATAAVRSHLHAPSGWTVIAIRRGACSLGFLAVGAPAAGGVLVELLATLLADQLERAALMRARKRAVVQRLVRDPDAGSSLVRREAAEAGVELADAYWLALLVWRKIEPRREAVETIEREASPAGDGALMVPLPGGVLLLRAAGGDRSTPGWFGDVARTAKRLAPASGPQVIVGERPAELPRLSVRVVELRALARLRLQGEDGELLVPAQRYAIDRLLWQAADTAQARRFVDDQIGELLAWEQEHNGDLLSVLEAALDFPRHERAAAQCFMHRNTFRHRLRQAMEILDRDLENPDVRLGVHVALRMRRLLQQHAADGNGATGAAPPVHRHTSAALSTAPR